MSSSDRTGLIINTAETDIADPADEHFEESYEDFVEYENAVETSGAATMEYLIEPNYEMAGRRGNQSSRQGFDFDSFHDRS